MKEKIRELLDKTGLDQILLFNNLTEEPHLHYFTGLPAGQFQRNALVLRKNKKPLVITTVLWNGMLKKRNDLNSVQIENKKEYLAALKKALPGKKIGLNYGDFSHRGIDRLKRKLKGKRFVDIGKAIGKVRETKTEKEKKKISKAVSLTSLAFKEMKGWKVQGLTERALALKLEIFVREQGAEQVSFPVIVASGQFSGTPHHVSSNKKIGKGILLIDFGARYQNYCADLSRVYSIGKPSDKNRKLYSLVWETKKKAVEAAKAGVSASSLFDIADKELKDFGGMIHALGHGIGIQDHDFPAGLSKKSRWKLRENMCLAIEPAIYGKFGGVRIEDNYIVGKKELKPLSKAPETLIELR